jgi:hypothetical protein
MSVCNICCYDALAAAEDVQSATSAGRTVRWRVQIMACSPFVLNMIT